VQSFGGGVVQRFQRGKDEVKVRVRYPDEDRQTFEDIQLANVRTSDGTIVPLSHVAQIFNDYQPSNITRIDSQRAVYIRAVLDKDKIASNELDRKSVVKEKNLEQGGGRGSKKKRKKQEEHKRHNTKKKTTEQKEK